MQAGPLLQQVLEVLDLDQISAAAALIPDPDELPQEADVRAKKETQGIEIKRDRLGGRRRG